MNIYISVNRDIYGNYVLHELYTGLTMKYIFYTKEESIRNFKKNVLHLPKYTRGVVLVDHTKTVTVSCGARVPKKYKV